MTAIASLPMYDLPGMRAANRALWMALTALLRADGYMDSVEDAAFDEGPGADRLFPETLFTQQCGYPLQTLYRGKFQLLATPSYDVPGCGDMTHSAFIVVREADAIRNLEDLRGGRFAINGPYSNSGMNLPRLLFAPLAREGKFFGDVVESGGHVRSMTLLREGRADAASIDCVTWAFAGDHEPELLQGLRVLAQTASSPAIPFVTGIDTHPAWVLALRSALLTIGSDPAYRTVCAGLRLASIGVVPWQAYDLLLRYEEDAVRAGYPEIA